MDTPIQQYMLCIGCDPTPISLRKLFSYFRTTLESITEWNWPSDRVGICFRVIENAGISNNRTAN